MSLHRLAEERSLAYHRKVAERLERDPSLLDTVRARLDEWIAAGGRSAAHAKEWRAIVDLPLQQLVAFLGEESERARELRQSTPFAGLIEPRERWRLWEDVRARFVSERAADSGDEEKSS